ncbi:MAG: hypothetical protein J7480_03860 [Microbacteriaceae bacterium]|nr:hypothetical protein [Microbacteriaceae bacterium]
MTDQAPAAPGDELVPAPETALVEVSPGTALVFGKVPDGLELVPFRLITSEDQKSLSAALAAGGSAFNVGGQVVNAIAQAQGLVRLAPETLKALEAGAQVVKSNGYNLGTLRNATGFSDSVRWLPAGGATAAGVVASLGPAVAMIAIQIQLHEMQGLLRQNMALTEGLLKAVRNEQWSELVGLDAAVSKALDEVNDIGEVTPGVWQNVHGYEKDLQKHRDLYRRQVETHAAELAKGKTHQDRRQYIERNGETILLDLHSLLIAHKSWFEYQALRAGRARVEAISNPSEGKLLDKIIRDAKTEYEKVGAQMGDLLDILNRELSILAELPGKPTIPFTGSRRAARDVADMSKQLLDAVNRVSDMVRHEPPALEAPTTSYVAKEEQRETDLRILRWHLASDEHLHALVQVDGDESTVFSSALVAITDRRVLIANAPEFRKHGAVRRSIPNEDIRFVRVRDLGGKAGPSIDLITSTDNLSWTFGGGGDASTAASRFAALLAENMDIPSAEREALLVALPSKPKNQKALTSDG